MKTSIQSRRRALTALISSLTFAVPMASQAAGTNAGMQPAVSKAATPNADDLSDAVAHIDKAQQLVRQMRTDPDANRLLQRAKGVFLVPDYGRAAAGIGAQGGAGVLMVRREGKWLGPSFYNLGSVSAGLQAGVTAGAIALILMDDKAVNSFATDNNFSLDANAGISIINWSARGQASAGKGDVVLWSDTEGAFLGASIAVSDINFDEDETAALYRRNLAARDILMGRAVLNTPAQARGLVRALPAG